jgi:hypothetical protein
MRRCDMPRRRKGIKYIPEIPILLRDAQPTQSDIERDPDARKRQRQATDILVKMCRDAEKCGKIYQLDLSVRNFCEGLKASNRRRHRRRLPKPKGGRPTDEGHRLFLRVKVHEEIEAREKSRGGVEAALRDVATEEGVSYDHLRDTYYDRDLDPAVEVEFNRRNRFALWFWDVQADWTAAEIIVAKDKKPWWRPWVEQAPASSAKRF